ncbi:MAG: hypothetical protein IJX72_06010, partial [Clostridia bacterium]|nr:hypothetical protein [Clostridia bacterium]
KIEFALKRSATPKNTGTSTDTVDVTFQIVYDYVTTDPTTGATQSGRKVLSSQTEKIIKGATVDWKPTWQNTNDDWHPETGTITYNGKTIEFSEPEENADEYDYTFHLGDVNAGGTVIWIVNGDFVNDAAQGYTWTQNFDKTAGKTALVDALREL